MKRFLEWFGLKETLHEKQHRTPLVSERDIWWASIGENVGSEINGKSERFSRPVIIFKKLSHGFYFVIPTTTQAKEGSWFVPFVHKDKAMTACLHQARAIDYRRLSNKLGRLDTADYERVAEGFATLYVDKNIPRSFERGRD
jgi:mRNA interferase MazF